MKAAFLTLLILAFCTLCACSQSASHPDMDPKHDMPGKTLDEKLDLSAVKLGATRVEIESILGAPMSENISERGLECMYILGMKGFHMPGPEAMGGMQAVGTLQGLIGMAAPLAGPAGGLAGGVASEVLGMGSSLAASAAMPSMPDPSQIRMVMVGYRDGRAISINRMNPSAMGEAPIDQ